MATKKIGAQSVGGASLTAPETSPAVRSAVLAATSPSLQKAGFSIREFCQSCGFSVAKFYLLTGDEKPRTVKLHGRVLVIEQPIAYLERMAARCAVADSQQGVRAV